MIAAADRHGVMRMQTVKSIISLVLIIAVLVFAIQNTAAIEIELLLWRFSVPRALLITALLGTGFVIGMLFYSLAIRRRHS